MWFINNGDPVKIRIGGIENCDWVTIRKGQKIELSPEVGTLYGFPRIRNTEGKIGNKVVETKQIEEKLRIMNGS